MHHNELEISLDLNSANELLMSPVGNPLSEAEVQEAQKQTPSRWMIARYRKLDRKDISFYVEKWTTHRGSPVYVIYNTLDQKIFISSRDPAAPLKRE
jgi:hypothetical protein